MADADEAKLPYLAQLALDALGEHYHYFIITVLIVVAGYFYLNPLSEAEIVTKPAEVVQSSRYVPAAMKKPVAAAEEAVKATKKKAKKANEAVAASVHTSTAAAPAAAPEKEQVKEAGKAEQAEAVAGAKTPKSKKAKKSATPAVAAPAKSFAAAAAPAPAQERVITADDFSPPSPVGATPGADGSSVSESPAVSVRWGATSDEGDEEDGWHVVSSSKGAGTQGKVIGASGAGGLVSSESTPARSVPGSAAASAQSKKNQKKKAAVADAKADAEADRLARLASHKAAQNEAAKEEKLKAQRAKATRSENVSKSPFSALSQQNASKGGDLLWD